MNQEQLQALLKARAEVKPPADYSEKLLRTLHERQRSILLQKSLWRLAVERLGTFLSEHSLSTPRYALGWAAIFAVGLAAILLLRPQSGSPPLARQPASAVAPMLQPPVDAQQVNFQSQPK